MDKRICANIDFVRDWPNRTSQGKNEAGREEVLHAIHRRGAGRFYLAVLVEKSHRNLIVSF
jgi:hypothetical protein